MSNIVYAERICKKEEKKKEEKLWLWCLFSPLPKIIFLSASESSPSHSSQSCWYYSGPVVFVVFISMLSLFPIVIVSGAFNPLFTQPVKFPGRKVHAHVLRTVYFPVL